MRIPAEKQEQFNALDKLITSELEDYSSIKYTLEWDVEEGDFRAIAAINMGNTTEFELNFRLNGATEINAYEDVYYRIFDGGDIWKYIAFSLWDLVPVKEQ